MEHNCKYLYRYRYRINLGELTFKAYKILKETEEIYFCNKGARFLKKDEDRVVIKVFGRNSINYPYIELFATKDITREQVVDKIKIFLTREWGLN